MDTKFTERKVGLSADCGWGSVQDLVLYKKFRNKEVAAAARGLIGLFRELNPSMLEKKDRGRGADLEAAPLSYGASRVQSRVEGAQLLQVRHCSFIEP